MPSQEAEDGLVEYFRCISGEHPDWDEYREAMRRQGKSLIRITVESWGPVATGGSRPTAGAATPDRGMYGRPPGVVRPGDRLRPTHAASPCSSVPCSAWPGWAVLGRDRAAGARRGPRVHDGRERLDDQPLRADARGHHRRLRPGLRPGRDPRTADVRGRRPDERGRAARGLGPDASACSSWPAPPGRRGAAIPTLGVAISPLYDGDVRGPRRLAGVGTAAAICLGPLAGGVVEDLLGWRAVMALPILGALRCPSSGARSPGGQRRPARRPRRGARRRHGRRPGDARPVAVDRPAVAVVGVLLLVLGAPAWRSGPAPPVRLPAAVGDAQPHRGPQRVAAAAVPAAWFALLIAVPAVLVPTAGRRGRSASRCCRAPSPALFAPRVAAPARPDRGTLARGRRRHRPGRSSWPPLGAAAPRRLLVVAVVAVTFAFGLGQPALMAVGEARCTRTCAGSPSGSPR